MMSTRDFEFKQLAFVFTSKGEKISFKNDNLLISDENGKIKHQSTCYRLFLLFICGDFCITSGLLERSNKFGFNIVLMSPNLRVTKIIPSKAEGNVLLRRIQYEYSRTDIAAKVISNKIHNQMEILQRKRNKTDDEKNVILKLPHLQSGGKVLPDHIQEIYDEKTVNAIFPHRHQIHTFPKEH